MKKPKIGIFKMFFFQNGHKRWFGADLSCNLESGRFDIDDLKNKKKVRPKLPIIDLKEYPEIETEKDLLLFLKQNWGNGTFMVIAFGGRGNTFVFWKGNLDDDGFKFFKQTYDKRDINEMKMEMAYDKLKGDSSNKEFDKEFIEELKQDAKEEKALKRYGFFPFLKSSGKRGTFVLWSSEEINANKEKWGLEENTFEDWGKTEQVEFQKW